MIGKTFAKPLVDKKSYAQAAQWCNENRARIVERETYYEIVEIPAPSFDELCTVKLAELSSSFNDRVSGAFTTSQGYSMQFDTSDAIKMQGAIQLLEATGAAEGYLTQANDETIYNVPLDTMKAVLIEMMTAFAACHARKQELRAAINAAETKEDLDAIEITWPI